MDAKWQQRDIKTKNKTRRFEEEEEEEDAPWCWSPPTGPSRETGGRDKMYKESKLTIKRQKVTQERDTEAELFDRRDTTNRVGFHLTLHRTKKKEKLSNIKGSER